MIVKPFRVLLLLSLASAFCWSQETIDFGRDVLPILSENCFFCHGPDANHREADLRLDQRESAVEKGAINTKDSTASTLLSRIRSTDPDEQMPPPSSNRTLDERQKKLLSDWIAQGAQYKEHWSFIAPIRPNVPQVPATAIVHNPIDNFIVERLDHEGFKQSPQADAEKLLRRVTLDLTGLPPTIAELNAFLSDPSESAYQQVVQRLLDSPRFGERMVWDWMDAARYADTNGYQGDPTRPMWYWRDWVIRAFNTNMPFDQFTLEQLAGDLLPNPTMDQFVATGFHRNHMINGEGGRIAEESRVEYVQDRVETTGTVWMGLTLTCCRCHDHKYDPFTQKQYYALSAYFNSIDESGGNDAGGLANPIQVLATPEQSQNLQNLSEQERQKKSERDVVEQRLRSEQESWEKSFSNDDSQTDGDWRPLIAAMLHTDNGTELKQVEEIFFAKGNSPDTENYSLDFSLDARGITAIKLECLPDSDLINSGPGRADNGNFVLSELQCELNGNRIGWKTAMADFSQAGWADSGAIDGKSETGWAVMPEFGKPHSLILVSNQPLEGAGEDRLNIKMQFHFGRQHSLGKFRIFATTISAERVRPISGNLKTVLAKPVTERSDAEKAELTKFFLSLNSAYTEAQAAFEQARSKREEFERSLPKTMVMRERAQPRETFVLAKGAYNAPGEKVTHAVLENLLSSKGDEPRNRKQLAEWLISAQHPLTARVIVNRYWQTFFGTGLVKTAEDFGLQGERPSHPELLDWLAVEFRESGWNVKELVRLIVTSHTYRQSSVLSPDMVERDPGNRFLSHAPRIRIPSWMLRDQALSISGLLVEHLGGPPVKGYQPQGIWEDATFGQIRYEQDHGESLYRRSLYIFWRRIVAPTMFFDVANRQNCSVKSVSTNTPLHALTTLNDVTYVEAARAFAQRALKIESLKTDDERIEWMWQMCNSRKPRVDEVTRIRIRLGRLREHFANHLDEAKSLITVGESVADAGLEPSELASWAAVASILLNLDETLTKE